MSFVAFKTFRAAAVCQNAEFSFGPFCKNTTKMLIKVECSTPEFSMFCYARKLKGLTHKGRQIDWETHCVNTYRVHVATTVFLM